MGDRIHSKIFGLFEIKRAIELNRNFALRYSNILGNQRYKPPFCPMPDHATTSKDSRDQLRWERLGILNYIAKRYGEGKYMERSGIMFLSH